MRTTVDLPAELMRAAKARAAERGESLKELFARALAHEMAIPAGRGEARMELPLVGRGAAPTVHLSNAEIEAALGADDAERYAG